jgi:hypothetical protein
MENQKMEREAPSRTPHLIDSINGQKNQSFLDENSHGN